MVKDSKMNTKTHLLTMMNNDVKRAGIGSDVYSRPARITVSASVALKKIWNLLLVKFLLFKPKKYFFILQEQN